MRVLITGANRGIGAALAAQYKSAGATVLGTARTPTRDDLIRLDVTDPGSFQTLAQHLGDTPLDLVICNAGIFADRAESLTGGYPAQIWAETFATNVTGVFQTVQTALPNLQKPGGKIAIIASQMGASTKASGTALIYRTSKAAAINLGLNLATALEPDGIAVGIYHPGWVRSDMGGDAADISIDQSATGLAQRFATLSIATTGCFETWDGQPHPI